MVAARRGYPDTRRSDRLGFGRPDRRADAALFHHVAALALEQGVDVGPQFPPQAALGFGQKLDAAFGRGCRPTRSLVSRLKTLHDGGTFGLGVAFEATSSTPPASRQATAGPGRTTWFWPHRRGWNTSLRFFQARECAAARAALNATFSSRLSASFGSARECVGPKLRCQGIDVIVGPLSQFESFRVVR